MAGTIAVVGAVTIIIVITGAALETPGAAERAAAVSALARHQAGVVLAVQDLVVNQAASACLERQVSVAEP